MRLELLFNHDVCESAGLVAPEHNPKIDASEPKTGRILSDEAGALPYKMPSKMQTSARASSRLDKRLNAWRTEHRHLQTNAGEDQPPPDDEPGDAEGDVLTAPAEPKLKRPPMYKVLILNDDYTPMEFVVHVLESFFVLSREKATQVMLSIHTTGSGVAGIFPRDIAETKSEQVNQYAQENNHPLMSTVEMTD